MFSDETTSKLDWALKGIRDRIKESEHYNPSQNLKGNFLDKYFIYKDPEDYVGTYLYWNNAGVRRVFNKTK